MIQIEIKKEKKISKEINHLLQCRDNSTYLYLVFDKNNIYRKCKNSIVD